LGDAPNHYAFVFPIRPGETRFQITYRLPYSGSFKFTPRLVMPTDTVAIMMPKSMKFVADPSTSYSAVTEEVNAQTYVARTVVPSEPMGFTVSGEGQLPRDSAAGASSDPAAGASGAATGTAPQAGQQSAAADTKPGGGLGNPIDPEGTNDPWAKYKWWILGGLGLVLATGAGVMLKNSETKEAASAKVPPTSATTLPVPDTLLNALKEELFALETEHLQGKLSEANYVELKAALETVLRHALTRIERSTSASNTQVPATIGEPEIR
jgi:hypothetical protein